MRFIEKGGCDLDLILTEPDVPAILFHLGKYIEHDRTRIFCKGMLIFHGWCLVVSPRAMAKFVWKFLSANVPESLREALDTYFHSKIRKYDVIFGRFLNEKEISFVSETLSSINPDTVLFDTIFLANLCLGERNGTRNIIITHDVFHLRHKSFRDKNFRVYPREITRDMETSILNKFDVIVAIQEEEEKILREMAPGKEVVTVPMPVERNRPAETERIRGRCIFVGSGSLHNEDGLRWFLTSVWPDILGTVPDAQLHVYGTVCARLHERPERVVFHGRVPDLTDAYRSAAVAIAPVRAGSGLKIKIIEYFSFGLPCVTTSVGAYGLPSADRLPFVKADTAEEFGGHLRTFLTDDAWRKEFEQNAYVYCDHFSEENVFRPLLSYIRP